MDFLSTIYSNVISRIISGEIGLPQTARCRKLTKGDVLKNDPWNRKGRRKHTKGGQRGRFFSSEKQNTNTNQRKKYEITNSFCIVPSYLFNFRAVKTKKHNNNSIERNDTSSSTSQDIDEVQLEILRDTTK